MIFDLKNKENKLRILYNKESNMEIKVGIADSFSSRLLGLMFKKKTEYPLLFEIPNTINRRHRSSIHSLFMRFDIVLVFIDGNNLVYEITDLAPWNYYVPEKSAKYIVEFDKKEFNNCLKIGDEIEIR